MPVLIKRSTKERTNVMNANVWKADLELKIQRMIPKLKKTNIGTVITVPRVVVGRSMVEAILLEKGMVEPKVTNIGDHLQRKRQRSDGHNVKEVNMITTNATMGFG